MMKSCVRCHCLYAYCRIGLPLTNGNWINITNYFLFKNIDRKGRSFFSNRHLNSISVLNHLGWPIGYTLEALADWLVNQTYTYLFVAASITAQDKEHIAVTVPRSLNRTGDVGYVALSSWLGNTGAIIFPTWLRQENSTKKGIAQGDRFKDHHGIWSRHIVGYYSRLVEDNPLIFHSQNWSSRLSHDVHYY